jgi:hypothetical protein
MRRLQGVCLQIRQMGMVRVYWIVTPGSNVMHLPRSSLLKSSCKQSSATPSTTLPQSQVTTSDLSPPPYNRYSPLPPELLSCHPPLPPSHPPGDCLHLFICHIYFLVTHASTGRRQGVPSVLHFLKNCYGGPIVVCLSSSGINSVVTKYDVFGHGMPIAAYKSICQVRHFCTYSVGFICVSAVVNGQGLCVSAVFNWLLDAGTSAPTG